jgi:hypothetical protein
MSEGLTTALSKECTRVLCLSNIEGMSLKDCESILVCGDYGFNSLSRLILVFGEFTPVKCPFFGPGSQTVVR